MFQHVRREFESALVVIEAKNLVRIVSVITSRLQIISVDLVGEAIAAPLLIQIEQNAAVARRHVADGAAELVAAVAFETAEKVSGEASGMQTHRHRLRKIRAADNDRHLVSQAFTAAKNHEF